MSDIEIVKACAEAMGYTPYRAAPGGVIQVCSETGIYICDASDKGYGEYDPLKNGGQAFALVKRFRILVKPMLDRQWFVSAFWEETEHLGDDLNRVICECVATIRRGK